MKYKVEQIPTDIIKFFVRRWRRESAYGRLKQSIREVGLKVPIGVRSISGRPHATRRRRRTGGHYQYELVYGQGRLQAFRELGIKAIPAVVIDVKKEEIVGRFLAENVMRRKTSWREKAELIRYDYETNDLDIDEIAKRYCITKPHAAKYLKILTGASDKTLARASENNFSLAETEKLTTLSQEGQEIVIGVMDEEGLDKSAIKDLVDQAAKLRDNGKLTKGSLKESIQTLNQELKKCRDKLKLKRLEYALGPQHLFRLAEDEMFVAKAEDAGIDISYFTKGQAL